MPPRLITPISSEASDTSDLSFTSEMFALGSIHRPSLLDENNNNSIHDEDIVFVPAPEDKVESNAGGTVDTDTSSMRSGLEEQEIISASVRSNSTRVLQSPTRCVSVKTDLTAGDSNQSIHSSTKSKLDDTNLSRSQISQSSKRTSGQGATKAESTHYGQFHWNRPGIYMFACVSLLLLISSIWIVTKITSPLDVFEVVRTRESRRDRRHQRKEFRKKRRESKYFEEEQRKVSDMYNSTENDEDFFRSDPKTDQSRLDDLWKTDGGSILSSLQSIEESLRILQTSRCYNTSQGNEDIKHNQQCDAELQIAAADIQKLSLSIADHAQTLADLNSKDKHQLPTSNSFDSSSSSSPPPRSPQLNQLDHDLDMDEITTLAAAHEDTKRGRTDEMMHLINLESIQDEYADDLQREEHIVEKVKEEINALEDGELTGLQSNVHSEYPTSKEAFQETRIHDGKTMPQEDKVVMLDDDLTEQEEESNTVLQVPDASNFDEITRILVLDIWSSDATDVQDAIQEIVWLLRDSDEIKFRTIRAISKDIGGFAALTGAIRKWYRNENIQKVGVEFLWLILENDWSVFQQLARSTDAVHIVLAAMKNYPGNESIQQAGCGALNSLTRTTGDYSQKLVTTELEIIDASIEAMMLYPLNQLIRRYASKTLYKMSRWDVLRKPIQKKGGLKVLNKALKLMNDDEVDTRNFASYALRRLE